MEVPRKRCRQEIGVMNGVKYIEDGMMFWHLSNKLFLLCFAGTVLVAQLGGKNLLQLRIKVIRLDSVSQHQNNAAAVANKSIKRRGYSGRDRFNIV